MALLPRLIVADDEPNGGHWVRRCGSLAGGAVWLLRFGCVCGWGYGNDFFRVRRIGIHCSSYLVVGHLHLIAIVGKMDRCMRIVCLGAVSPMPLSVYTNRGTENRLV
jgi:hypothetical protein